MAYAPLSAAAATDLPFPGDSVHGPRQLWSKLTLQFLNPLLKLGKTRPVQQDDLAPLPERFSAQTWHDKVQGAWGDETAKAAATGRKASLTRALLRLGWRRLLTTGLLNLVEIITPIVQVLCLRNLVTYLAGDSSSHGTALAWLALLATQIIIGSVLRQYAFADQRALGMSLCSGVSSMLFSKSMALPSNTSKGTVVTLVSTDAVRIRSVLEHIHLLWITPLNILSALTMCWMLLGSATLGALGVVAVLLPINWLSTQQFEVVQDKMLSQQQSRMKRFTEILQGIQVIKLFSWEHTAAARVGHFRKKELGAVLSFNNALVLVMTVIWSCGTLMAVAAFCVYYLQGHPLLAPTVFPVLYLCDFLTFPLLELPYTIGDVVGTLASIRRLEAFLGRTQVQSARDDDYDGPGADAGAGVGTGTGAGAGGSARAVAPRGDSPGVSCAETAMRTAASLHGATLYWTAAEKSGDDKDGDDKAASSAGSSGCLSRLSAASRCCCCSSSSTGAAPPPPPTSSSTADVESVGGAQEASVQLLKPPTPLSRLSSAHGSGAYSDTVAPTLCDVSLSVRPGELVAVVGPVGAGKSSLLSALLGELLPTPPSSSSSPPSSAEPPRAHVPGGASSALRACVQVHAPNVVYAAQGAWIRSATIKDNILCGCALDASLYGQVLDVCALRPDLALFPAKDMTEVGEKGVTLSGGQKARLSLARAVYRTLWSGGHTLCLLDDPLSAVDAHVGETLFKDAIQGALAGHSRVLVTHQLQFLPSVDRVVVMEGGRIVHSGSYTELVSAGVTFASLEVDMSGGTPSADTPTTSDTGLSRTVPLACALPAPVMGYGDDADFCVPQLSLIRNSSDEYGESEGLAPMKVVGAGVGAGAGVAAADSGAGAGATVSASVCITDASGTATTASEVVVSVDAGKTIEDEERYTGAVGWRVYAAYFGAYGGPAFLVTLVAVSVLLEAVKASTSVWLSVWSDAEQQANEGGKKSKTTTYLAVYVALGLGTALFSLWRNLLFFRGAWRAAGRMHDLMLGAVLRSPASWFHTTPQGRILNRFSKDQTEVDQHLPDRLSDTLLSLLELLSRVTVIIVASPVFTVFLPFLAYAYTWVASMYRASARELKRLQGIAASPVHSLFSEVLDGLTTLRAYRLERQELQALLKRADANNTAFFYNVMSNAWVAIRIDFTSAAIVTIIGLLAVVARWTGASWLMGSTSMLPLSITYAISLTGTCSWLIRAGTQAEARMSRVERMMHYAKLPPEAPLTSTAPATPDHLTVGTAPAAYEGLRTPPAEWPASGAVTFSGCVMRYRPTLPAVLNGVSFTVPSGTKVGVVGRTGAGKSSLLMALFRIVELSEGSITLDGVDLKTMGLREARRAMAIIPQDPVLFSGTFRSNLDGSASADPQAGGSSDTSDTAVSSDAELWEALDKCGMKAYVASQAGGLDGVVEEGGQNLSVGQRQLLSLARALLRRTKVLVLDEATASVDPETDNFIQATVRESFKDATIMTIAHRLPTVVDYDRILVMDAGRVAEYDHPHALLSSAGASMFGGMVDSTGPESARFLRAAARQSWRRRQHRQAATS